MKLVFLGPTYPHRGGIARYGTLLLAELQKRHDSLGIGFERLYPAFLFPGQSQLDADAHSSESPAIERILHYARPGSWARAARRIDEFAPDAVVLTWWVTFWAPYLGWLARRLARRHRLIYLCHNVYPHEAAFIDRPLVRFALKPAGRFIVHSEENRRQLLQLFPEARVLRRAHPAYGIGPLSTIEPGEARRRLGIEGRMLLFFGFVRAYKGLDLAIEALAKVKDDLSDLSLWICGEFWDNQRKYDRLIERYGLQNRVRIEAGYLPQNDLALRISACDGVLLPYRSVTGSGILGNAFAMNKPVIASNTGSLGEMVRQGRSGLLCKPNDSAALAQTIRDFYAGEGPKRFSAGVEEAKAEFSWDGIVRAIEELAQDG